MNKPFQINSVTVPLMGDVYLNDRVEVPGWINDYDPGLENFIDRIVASGADSVKLIVHTVMNRAADNGIELMFIQPGKPNQNAFIERFNRSFRNEVLDANLFNSVSEAQTAADEWVTDYNQFRSHESLGNVPPVQYMPREINGGSLHL